MLEDALVRLPGPLETPDLLAVSSDERWLAALTSDGTLYLWDLRSAELTAVHPCLCPHASALAFLDEQLLVALYDGFDVIDPATGECTGQWRGVEVWGCNGLEVRGSEVVFAGDKCVFVTRDLQPSATLGPWHSDDRDRPHSIRGLAVNADATRFGIVLDGFTTIVDLDGVEIKRLDEARTVGLGPDGSVIWSTWQSGQLLLPDGATLVLEYDFDDVRWTDAGWLAWDHESAMLYSAAGETLWASRYHDGLRAVAAGTEQFYTTAAQWVGIRSWDDGGVTTRLPAGGGAEIGAMAFSHDGATLMVADRNGRIALWDASTGSLNATIDASSTQPADSAVEIDALGSLHRVFEHDGRLHAIGNQHWVWDHVAAPPETDDRSIDALRGNVIVAHDSETGRKRVERLDGEPLGTLSGCDGYGLDFEPSPTGEYVLVSEGGETGTTLRLWQASSGAFVSELRIDQPCHAAAFDLQGRIIGWVDTQDLVDWDEVDDDDYDKPTGVFFRWDPSSGEVSRWSEAEADANEVHIAGDSVLLLGGEDAWLARLDGQDVRALRCGSRPREGALAPTGKLAAVALDNGIVRLVNVETQVVMTLCLTSDGASWRMLDDELSVDQRGRA